MRAFLYSYSPHPTPVNIIPISQLPKIEHTNNDLIDLYIASRTIYGLAKEGKAPAFLARTNKRGVPYAALLCSALFSFLAFMNVVEDSKVVFGYFVNLVTIFGIYIPNSGPISRTFMLIFHSPPSLQVS